MYYGKKRFITACFCIELAYVRYMHEKQNITFFFLLILYILLILYKQVLGLVKNRRGLRDSNSGEYLD